MFSFQLLVVIEYTISKLTSTFWLKFIYSWVKMPTEVGLISKSHYSYMSRLNVILGGHLIQLILGGEGGAFLP